MRHIQMMDRQPRGGSAPFLARAQRQRIVGMLFGLLLLPVGVIAQEAGDLDTSFGANGKVITDFSGSNDEAQAVVLQPDGKIIPVGHTFNVATLQFEFALARYLPDGTLDTTFGGDGRVTTDFGEAEPVAVANAAALQPDGKIIAAGRSGPHGGGSNFALARYQSDGTLDTTFGGDGRVTTVEAPGEIFSVAVQPDGKIVAAGGLSLARYLPDGTPDTTFGNDGLVSIADLVTIAFDEVFAAALQPDGKIVAAGKFFNPSTTQQEFALARYLPDGTLDTPFDSGGHVTTDVGGSGFASAVALEPDGKIVAAGSIFNVATSHLDFALARYLPDGTLDTTFGGDGRVTTDFGVPSSAHALALQADGKIVAVGGAFFVRFALARYRPDGSLDTTFGDDGLVTTDVGGANTSFADALVIQPLDGRLVVAGSSSVTGQDIFDFALARYDAGLVGVGPPTNQEECKHNGWRTFTIPRAFRNQGDCIQFVNTGR
jgi:uncharacterized delta-60 repeat protein